MIMQRHVNTLYATDQHENAVRPFLQQHIQPIRAWAEKYLGGRANARLANSQDDMCIPRVLQAEENIWSPTYGMKGKVDLAVTSRPASTLPMVRGRHESGVIELANGAWKRAPRLIGKPANTRV
eukprot:COSAG01_NODE_49531_length_371_cov_0.941176_1_plen_123_part_11